MSEIGRTLVVAASAAAIGLPGPARADLVSTDPANSGTHNSEFIDDCVNEALGVETTDQRATFNPADFVGSGYIGKSLRRFYVELNAPEVSEECNDVIDSRQIKVDQIYRGEVNTPKSLVFAGLDAKNQERKTTTLNRRFTGIKGRGVRGYKVRVAETIEYEGGLYKKIGIQTVRGATDGV